MIQLKSMALRILMASILGGCSTGPTIKGKEQTVPGLVRDSGGAKAIYSPNIPSSQRDVPEGGNLYYSGNLLALSEADQRVRDRLDAELPRIAYEKVTLEWALADISKKAGITIVVDWPGIRDAGLSPMQVFSLHLIDQQVETAIREVLTKATGKEGALDWRIHKGTVCIEVYKETRTVAPTQ